MPAKIRTVLFGELAVLAARVNEFCYDAAVKANRLQGWAVRRRDAR
jgi:hypothetical protein